MFNKLEKYQINGNIVGSVSGFQVDNSDPENVVILETANIDGSNTIGGVWWIDRILSDRFTGEKQVLHAISDDTLEVGNNDLEDVYLLGKSVNSFKVKYGSNIEQMWHSGNLVNVSQLENDVNYTYNDGSNATGDLQETIAWKHVHWNMNILENTTVAFTNALKDAYDAKLDVEDLDGFVYNVQYNSSAHEITFYLQNEPNIVIDLAVEQLITGVQLVGNDLVFTFEDSSTVTVPMNTLLVGVVKSVNGLTPNSQGEVVINIADIPGLSSALDGKANAGGNNLTNIGTWQSNLNVLTTNTSQTELSGNKTTSGVWEFNGQQVPLRLYRGGGNISLRYQSDLGNIYAGIAGDSMTYVVSTGINLNTIANRVMWVSDIGLLTSRSGFEKQGRTDSSILLAGGGDRPVSDFVLTSDSWNIFKNTGYISPLITDLNNAPNATRGLANIQENRPQAGFSDIVVISQYGNDDQLQLELPFRGNNRLGWRTKSSSGFSDWVSVWYSGNFNPAQYVLQSSLNTQLANYVPINGVTTINNTKTFTSSPVVPNATLNSHAVNLGQLNSALDGNYLPLAGGTMDNGSVINWNSGTSAVIQQGGNNRIRATFSNTFISSSVSGTTDGIYLRPRGDINATGQVRINGNGQITTYSHGDSSQWYAAYQATQNLSTNYVPINGVTTINNTKTFTSSPVVPNATLNSHAVNLGQLNSALDGNYEQDILFSTDFNTADVVTINNPTIFYFTSFVDQLDFQVGSMRKGDELVVFNTSGVPWTININLIRQDGIPATSLSIQSWTATSFILVYISGNPYFAIKHRTDIY